MEGVKWELENHSSCGNQSEIVVEMRAGCESALEDQRQLQCPQHRTVAVGCRIKETSGNNKEKCGAS